MSVVHADSLPMTVEAFLAFTQTRPDEERWELIDGEPVLNPSPSWGHQKVVRNLVAWLTAAEDQGTSWEMLPGIGVKLSERSMPIPDVIVRPRHAIDADAHWCDDMIVAFEVLSPSSRTRDLRWKRLAYATLPSLQHYVVLGKSTPDLRCYDRETGWAERRLRGADASLDLPAIGVTLPARALYASMGLF